jgi:hypothetical protein
MEKEIIFWGVETLAISRILRVFQQEINHINSDTITAISQSPKCNPVPIRQHGVMMR